MSKKTLKFDNFKVNKKEFHAYKQPIALDSVFINKIILPQMSGYIKYFDNGGKYMSSMIKDNSVLVKYNEIWNKIKKTLNIKFHSMPAYDEKYI